MPAPTPPPPLDAAALADLAEKRAKMTAGEWRYVAADNVFISSAQGRLVNVQPVSHPPDVTVGERDANAEGIVALVNAAPALIQMAHDLLAVRANARCFTCDQLMKDCQCDRWDLPAGAATKG